MNPTCAACFALCAKHKCTVPSTRAQSASIKLTLAGCGRVSKRHIEAVQAVDGIDIAVVCDIGESGKIFQIRRMC